MPRPKEILRSCEIEVAKRRRYCARNRGHVIAAGLQCLVFSENFRKKNYCIPCGRRIVERGRKQLEKLSAVLDASGG